MCRSWVQAWIFLQSHSRMRRRQVREPWTGEERRETKAGTGPWRFQTSVWCCCFSTLRPGSQVRKQLLLWEHWLPLNEGVVCRSCVRLWDCGHLSRFAFDISVLKSCCFFFFLALTVPQPVLSGMQQKEAHVHNLQQCTQCVSSPNGDSIPNLSRD